MSRQDWFTGKRWGMFTHYLPVPAGDGTGQYCSAEDWNRRIDRFDAELLASHLHEVGADYFCITIGQNSGHYCAPNPVYDELVGISPSKCTRRDLIADISAALAPYGIDLWVYLPSGAPCAEPQAVERLEWVDGRGERLASFQRKWEAVIREWSLRWGTRMNRISRVLRPPFGPEIRTRWWASTAAWNIRSCSRAAAMIIPPERWASGCLSRARGSWKA